jgi:hypothetical protein
MNPPLFNIKTDKGRAGSPGNIFVHGFILRQRL